MEKIPPGIEAKSIMIWLPGETQYNCLVIRLDTRVATSSTSKLWPYVLRSSGFGAGPAGGVSFFLMLLGPNSQVNYNPSNWHNRILWAVHTFLQWKKEGKTGWDQVIADGRDVFLFERDSVSGEEKMKERITFEEYLKRCPAAREMT